MGAHQQPVHQHGQQKPSSPSPGSTILGTYFLPRSAWTWLACFVLSLSLLHLLFCSPLGSQQTVVAPLLQFFNHTYSSLSSGVSIAAGQSASCDYSVGRWVWAPGHARRYNSTECNVKDAEDCIRNGRPDTGYLDWRWQPAGCRLPAFDPSAFLSEVRGKHVAFVGDSMARNQAESLLCLLSAAAPYSTYYGTDGHFRRWTFPAPHNVTISLYWAPFLVRAGGRSANGSMDHDILYLDALADRWSADADTMDLVVMSAGHWFWGVKAIYYNGSEVIGARLFPELNHTDIGFLRPFREAYRMSLQRLSSRPGGRPRTVVSATFSPNHFEGKQYDDPTACPNKSPYKEGERELVSNEKELRSIVYEETEAAVAASLIKRSNGVRFEVLDVTKLASMRPDGHPGPYMHRDPFANGVPEKLTTDCLHFCLPGPVDTFNDILLQIITKRR